MKESALEICRHSVAHIMAAAVLEIFPEAKIAIGPAIEDGFYYDFDLAHTLHPQDLAKIEKRMKKIIQQNIMFEKEMLAKAEAVKLFENLGQSYKLELLQEIPDTEVSIYKAGNFIDLCRGPHLHSTKEIKAFKLLKIAGAYWRGDEKNKMLQRIYGTAFATQEELDQYLKNLAEAEQRDHRRLGKDLELFSFHEEAPANVFFHSKGAFIFNELIDFARKENTKRGYSEVMTPMIMHADLWHRSGHWDNYRENMYFTQIDGKEFAVKPMNCPGGLLIYKSTRHSYREMPMRVAEFGRVHRHEKSGVTHGLFRVRTFVQDDAHIFCTEEQIEEEIKGVIEQVFYTYKKFGFKDFLIELSTMPEKAIGDKKVWDKAEAALKAALEHSKISYKLNPGDGAFYGPKIDFHIKDCLGRKWQCGTIQLDFSMPERFALEYTGSDGQAHQPVMIHRAIFGSLERFFGILIEHYAGAFPLWLAPVQVKLLPIADRHLKYTEKVVKELKEAGLRVEIDESSEKIGHKIRVAQLQKVPYMFIIGDKEVKDKKVALRSRKEGDLGAKSLKAILRILQSEIDSNK
ncbi:MAG: threonine--tRNA ligase [Candidatus Margulisbacteria bacterium]|nr:threonine--tRNA ligase [Candidatus Margulisiibacteriota bacterium]